MGHDRGGRAGRPCLASPTPTIKMRRQPHPTTSPPRPSRRSRSGRTTGCTSAPSASAHASFTCSASHGFNRCPIAFTNPRAQLINPVRLSTSCARARTTARSICACSPRCRIGTAGRRSSGSCAHCVLRGRCIRVRRHGQPGDQTVIISHELPLDQAPEAYRNFDNWDDGWTKVVLHPEAAVTTTVGATTPAAGLCRGRVGGFRRVVRRASSPRAKRTMRRVDRLASSALRWCTRWRVPELRQCRRRDPRMIDGAGGGRGAVAEPTVTVLDVLTHCGAVTGVPVA